MADVLSRHEDELRQALTNVVAAREYVDRVRRRLEDGDVLNDGTSLEQLDAALKTLDGTIVTFKTMFELGFAAWLKPDDFHVADLENKTLDELREWCWSAWGVVSHIGSAFLALRTQLEFSGRDMSPLLAANAAIPVPAIVLAEAHWLMSGERFPAAPTIEGPGGFEASFTDRAGNQFEFVQQPDLAYHHLATTFVSAAQAERPPYEETWLWWQACRLAASYERARRTGEIPKVVSILGPIRDLLACVKDYNDAGKVALDDLPRTIQARLEDLRKLVLWSGGSTYGDLGGGGPDDRGPGAAGAAGPA